MSQELSTAIRAATITLAAIVYIDLAAMILAWRHLGPIAGVAAYKLAAHWTDPAVDRILTRTPTTVAPPSR